MFVGYSNASFLKDHISSIIVIYPGEWYRTNIFRIVESIKILKYFLHLILYLNRES